MTDLAHEALKRRLAAVKARYRFRFAARPRITRSVDVLDQLISLTRDLAADSVQVVGADAPVTQEVREQLKLFDAERGGILAARDAGPHALVAHELAMRADFIGRIYRRHFAGQDRSTRDIALLEELSEALAGVGAALSTLVSEQSEIGFSDTLAVIQGNIALYKSEKQSIEEVHQSLDAPRLASALARAANDQFLLYRGHFSGLPRASRPLGVLDRVVSSLDRLRRDMALLKTRGLDSPDNANNIELISERHGAYSRELEVLTTVQAQLTPSQRREALVVEVRRIMALYDERFAGQGRVSRDLEFLGQLCDAMGFAEGQLTMLDSDEGTGGASEHWIGYARDGLHMLEHEYALVASARVQ